MAVKNISVTDTLETFRTEFNDLAANEFGDIATLDGSIVATNLVDAMNETISIATSTAGWTIEDSSSTRQIIGGGNVLRVFGTSNEIEAVVSAIDTLTIGLPNAVSLVTSLTAPTVNAGNLTLSNGSIIDSSGSISFGNENLTTSGTITGNSFSSAGTTHNLGTIAISGNEISSSDSTAITIADGLRVTGTISANAINAQSGNTVDFGNTNISTNGFIYLSGTFDSAGIGFEGSTVDSFQTFLQVVDPTADRNVLLPNESGTVITTGTIDGISESMMANDAIGQNELKSVATLEILNSSGTVVKTLYGAGA